jgi:excisionase family DNA binding protein
LSTNFSGDQPDLSDWISQAEAARIRGVSRQAISKLIRLGRLRTVDVGGHVLVSRAEISSFRSDNPGRPRGTENRKMDQIERLLNSLSAEQRRSIFNRLRGEFRIHRIEEVVGMDAERILEAFSRAVKATPMLLGILAEPAFEEYVLKELSGDQWTYGIAPSGQAYDFLVGEKGTESNPIRIQVKLQKGDKGIPVHGKPKAKKYLFSKEMLIVETQRSRKGSRRKKGPKASEGEDIELEGAEKGTRPYVFGQFDILAVSLYYSGRKWDKFMFTLEKWLLPDPESPGNLATYQPVSPVSNNDWTDNLAQCLEWRREGRTSRIGGGTIRPQEKSQKGEQPQGPKKAEDKTN